MRRLLLAALAVSSLFAQNAARRTFRLDELRTPPGFTVEVYANVTSRPRLMTIGPNGVLYVAANGNGRVVAIPEPNRVVTVLQGLAAPHDLKFRDGALYVADADGVLRFPGAVTEDLVIRSAGTRIISFPRGGQHSTRSLEFTPEGDIYFSAGSTCNFCNEADARRASITKYDAGGRNERVVMRGLRNAIGLAWHPVTGELWAGDHGGDNLGDDDPPEEINILKEGEDYGWPDCRGARREVNWGPQARPGRCGSTVAPEFEYTAHSAPIGLSFYTGSQLPASYLHDALLALHGSWNRRAPSGYQVIRIRAASGRATGADDLLWGFFDPATRTTSGRPAHAITAADGSIFVSDDQTNNIYRLRYGGPRIAPGGLREAARIEGAGRVMELYGERFGEDVRLFADGAPLELLYTSDGQLNFILPERYTGTVTLTVQNGRAMDELRVTVE